MGASSKIDRRERHRKWCMLPNLKVRQYANEVDPREGLRGVVSLVL